MKSENNSSNDNLSDDDFGFETFAPGEKGFDSISFFENDGEADADCASGNCSECGDPLVNHFEENDDEDNFEWDDDLELLEIGEDEVVEYVDAQRETAIMVKDNMIALMGIAVFDNKGAIFRLDPRRQIPEFNECTSREQTFEAFAKSKETSIRNGWKIAYSGPPLMG